MDVRAAGAVALAAVAFAGCSAADSGGPPAERAEAGARACVAGTTVLCQCPDGTAGERVCDPSGSALGACGPCAAANVVGDACPGIAVALAAGDDVVVAASTATASDDGAASCGGDGAPDVVYAITPAIDGVVHATVVGADGFDPLLHARASACGGGETACADATGAGGAETVAFAAHADEPTFLFVDGARGTSGPYTLTLRLEPTVAGDTCPGAALAVDPGVAVELSGDTSAAKGQYAGSGACDPSHSTPEVVYGVVPSQAGTLTVVVEPSPGFDAVLYAREGSCTKGDQIACAEQAGEGGEETLSFAASAGARYSVFVDGAHGSAGAFQLSIALGP